MNAPSNAYERRREFLAAQHLTLNLNYLMMNL